MHTIRLIILLVVAAVASIGATARPDYARRSNPPATDSIARPAPLRAILTSIAAAREDSDSFLSEAELRALIGRTFDNKYYVGLSAGKTWRPLERFGNYDSTLRVYNPKLGVAVRYSF